MSHIRLRIYGGWRSHIVVIKEAGVGHAINNRGGVCGSDAHCKGSSMVASINWRKFLTTQGTHHSAWRQQVGDRACSWQPVPRKNKAYRYPIPLYPYIIEAEAIKLIYCPTGEQTADILTKALPSTKAKHFAIAMGLRTV